MQAGFDHVGRDVDVVVTMDGDLQNDPRDIPVLLDKLAEGYDLIAGYRIRRQDKLVTRRIPSWIANRIIRLITGVSIRDNGCSLKAYRCDLLGRMRLYSEMHRFIPAMAAGMAGARIAEVGVRHHARTFGESKYGLSRVFKVLADLLTIKMIRTFRVRPLALFAAMAGLSMVLGTLFVVATLLAIFTFEPLKAVSVVFPGLALLWSSLAVFLLMLGLLGAAGTGIGLAVPLISNGLSQLFAVPDSFQLKIVVVLAVTAVFAASVYAGLERGIRRLSNLNVVLTLGLLLFVLITGPTLFILKAGTSSLGHVLQNFVRMNSWTEPIGESGFVETWTIFYWAWWIALGPYMGMFVARISRGRSIREVIFGMLGFGTAGCALFFIVFGNYALHLELSGTLSVTSLLQDEGAPQAIIAVVRSLPFSSVVLALFCVVCLVFMATTYDSAAYTLALGATRRIEVGQDPPRWHRLFWAFGIGVLPVTLMFLGGLTPFQTASVVVSLPLIAVGVLMAVSLVRSLREDQAEGS